MALTSYEPVKWEVELDKGVDLRGIVLSGYHRQAVSGAPRGTPITTLAYEEGDPSYLCAYQNLEQIEAAREDEPVPPHLPEEQKAQWLRMQEHGYDEKRNLYLNREKILRRLTGSAVMSFQGSYRGSRFIVADPTKATPAPR